MAIVIPLVLIGIVLPCFMIYKDGHDYQQVEDNMYPVDDDLIARLEFARGYLCKQMIYYKEKEIAQYRLF